MASTIHNPSQFDPADYVVEDYLDNKQPEYSGEPVAVYELALDDWRADMARTFGDDWRSKIHRCAHCGNGLVRWITAVRHLPTNDVVVFGSDCTERLGFANKFAFKLAQLKAKAEARRVRFTIYNKRAAFLAANPGVAEALAHVDDPIHARNTFVRDVLSKLDKYGVLSERQTAAVIASMARDREFDAKRAADASEPKGDAPSGRAEVSGVVVSIKYQESDYGDVRKMLVKLDNNSKVWVTASLDVSRGDRIVVRATWTPSRDDKSFAFGKRPHVVSRTPAVVQS